MIAIDYETFYSRQHTVSDMGPWAYAHHPDTDIYMVSVVGEGHNFVGDPKDFDWSQLEGKDLVSHNAAFDMVVTEGGISREIIPPVNYRSWSCSADLMAYCGYPRALNNAAEQSLGIDVPKLMRNWMSGKHWSDAVEKGKAQELLDYALRDSEYCLQLWEKHHHKWPVSERQLSAHTRTLIWRGVHVETDKLKEGITHLQELRETAGSQVPWASDGKILSLPTLRDYCAALGVPAPASLAKDSEECAEWEAKYGDKFPWIAALRDYRRTNMLLKKLEAMDRRVRPDGTIPVNLKYWGGHTGRWSGDAGVNLQNLPRGEMFGVDLRTMLTPRPGHKFVVCDLSQIEPRVLAWLAGDTPFLESIRSGTPLYEAHARQTMGWTGGKLKVESPETYQLAKARVLGLGYGCGPHKFRAVAHSMAGLTLEESECHTTVREWRQTNRPVTRFWNRLDQMLESAKNQRKERVEFGLPSGRSVYWWQPRPDHEDPRSIVVNQSKGHIKNYTWGGKMTENVVQALARDIFAHHLLEAEKAGIPVVWSVHDELVCEVPADQAEDALKELTRIMSTPPDWIPNIPLAAEGGIFDHYTK